MKIVVISEPLTLKLMDVDSRALVPHELRVSVAVSAVCGSDLKIIAQPSRPGIQTPGHEFAGKVIESYDGKTLLGERVTAFPMFSCLECEPCIHRNYRDCDYKHSLGYDLQGSFAEEVIIDERFAVRLYDEISYEEGALVEHLCCGLRLAKEAEKLLKQYDRILVVGDGPIALADLRFLKMRGFHNIVLVGKHSERMTFAMRLGARKAIRFDELVHSPLDGELFDALIFSVHDNRVIDHLFQWLNKGGKVFPQTRLSEEYMAQLADKSGATFGRAFAYHIDDFQEVMQLIVSGEIRVDELISSRIRLSDVDKAVPLLFSKKGIKTLITSDRCA